MFQRMSLKIKFIISSIALVMFSVLFIGGFTLQQFRVFSRDTIADTYNGLTEQGLQTMQISLEADLQRIEHVIDMAEGVAVRLAASSNMNSYLKSAVMANQITRKETTRIIEGLLETCRVQHNLLQTKVDNILLVAEYVMTQYGSPALAQGNMMKWSAIDQYSLKKSTVVLPNFKIGDTVVEKQFTFRLVSPVVDEVQNMMDVTCTIFQRANSIGDMLRIATNVKKLDGNRAISTYIPAVNPGGTANPVVAAVMKGETFRGRAYVVNAWYITAYTPIVDPVGDIIGALYVGVPQESETLRNAITKTRMGESGYAFVVDSTGTVLLHPDTGMNGKDIIADGRLPVFEEILRNKEAGIVKFAEYPFHGKEQVIGYTYFPDWDWILCVTYSWEEIAQHSVKDAFEVLTNEILTTYQTATLEIDGQKRPIFNQIRYLDAQGQEMIAVRTGELTQALHSKADTLWFQQSAALAQGETYHFGVEQAVNTEQVEMRICSPIFIDTQFSGLVVVNLDWEVACEILKQRTYGKTGYTFIVNDQGIVVTHPQFHFTDQIDLRSDIYGATFADIVQSQMLTGKSGYGKYVYDQSERFLMFAPLQVGDHSYSLAADTPVEEFLTLANNIKTDIENEFRQTTVMTIGIMVVGGLGALLIGLVISRIIRRPVIRAVHFAQKVSKGDLSETLDITSKDEMSTILQAINELVSSFKHMIGQIQHSAIQVTSSATELSASAQQQEATMLTQLQSTNNTVKAVKDISYVAISLVETMQHVAAMSQETADFANTGQEDLARMENAIEHMEVASRSISAKLETINEKAENITSVVTTITKVADQTNLLSLNAAIEAEKAGEYGRGFTVVAREIRRLADQTAIATLDIDQMVKEMQSAVSAGVMEMDKFIKEVQHSAEDIEKISIQLTRIIQQVQTLSPSFDNVKDAMNNQSDHAQEINQAMDSLSEEMQQTTESLKESFLAIRQLNEAAKGLQDEVSRFYLG